MSRAYEEGREFFREHLSAVKRMSSAQSNPYWPRGDDNFLDHDEHNRGLEEAERDYIQNDLGVANFLGDLKELCEKHGVEISAGCGCCGGGGYKKDATGYEWTFSF